MKRLLRHNDIINTTIKLADRPNVAWVKNLYNDNQIKINLKTDDIIDKIYALTDNGRYDYEITSVDCDVDYFTDDMTYNDLLMLQEILNDPSANIEAINAYLDTRDNDLQQAYKASQDCFSIEASDPVELAEKYIDEIGGLEQFSQKELERYFDYEQFGRELEWDFDYYNGEYYNFA